MHSESNPDLRKRRLSLAIESSEEDLQDRDEKSQGNTFYLFQNAEKKNLLYNEAQTRFFGNRLGTISDLDNEAETEELLSQNAAKSNFRGQIRNEIQSFSRKLSSQSRSRSVSCDMSVNSKKRNLFNQSFDSKLSEFSDNDMILLNKKRKIDEYLGDIVSEKEEEDLEKYNSLGKQLMGVFKGRKDKPTIPFKENPNKTITTFKQKRNFTFSKNSGEKFLESEKKGVPKFKMKLDLLNKPRLNPKKNLQLNLGLTLEEEDSNQSDHSEANTMKSQESIEEEEEVPQMRLPTKFKTKKKPRLGIEVELNEEESDMEIRRAPKPPTLGRGKFKMSGSSMNGFGPGSGNQPMLLNAPRNNKKVSFNFGSHFVNLNASKNSGANSKPAGFNMTGLDIVIPEEGSSDSDPESEEPVLELPSLKFRQNTRNQCRQVKSKMVSLNIEIDQDSENENEFNPQMNVSQSEESNPEHYQKALMIDDFEEDEDEEQKVKLGQQLFSPRNQMGAINPRNLERVSSNSPRACSKMGNSMDSKSEQNYNGQNDNSTRNYEIKFDPSMVKMGGTREEGLIAGLIAGCRTNPLPTCKNATQKYKKGFGFGTRRNKKRHISMNFTEEDDFRLGGKQDIPIEEMSNEEMVISPKHIPENFQTISKKKRNLKMKINSKNSELTPQNFSKQSSQIVNSIQMNSLENNFIISPKCGGSLKGDPEELEVEHKFGSIKMSELSKSLSGDQGISDTFSRQNSQGQKSRISLMAQKIILNSDENIKIQLLNSNEELKNSQRTIYEQERASAKNSGRNLKIKNSGFELNSEVKNRRGGFTEDKRWSKKASILSHNKSSLMSSGFNQSESGKQKFLKTSSDDTEEIKILKAQLEKNERRVQRIIQDNKRRTETYKRLWDNQNLKIKELEETVMKVNRENNEKKKDLKIVSEMRSYLQRRVNYLEEENRRFQNKNINKEEIKDLKILGTEMMEAFQSPIRQKNEHLGLEMISIGQYNPNNNSIVNSFEKNQSTNQQGKTSTLYSESNNSSQHTLDPPKINDRVRKKKEGFRLKGLQIAIPEEGEEETNDLPQISHLKEKGSTSKRKIRVQIKPKSFVLEEEADKMVKGWRGKRGINIIIPDEEPVFKVKSTKVNKKIYFDNENVLSFSKKTEDHRESHNIHKAEPKDTLFEKKKTAQTHVFIEGNERGQQQFAKRSNKDIRNRRKKTKLKGKAKGKSYRNQKMFSTSNLGGNISEVPKIFTSHKRLKEMKMARNFVGSMKREDRILMFNKRDKLPNFSNKKPDKGSVLHRLKSKTKNKLHRQNIAKELKEPLRKAQILSNKRNQRRSNNVRGGYALNIQSSHNVERHERNYARNYQKMVSIEGQLDSPRMEMMPNEISSRESEQNEYYTGSTRKGKHVERVKTDPVFHIADEEYFHSKQSPSESFKDSDELKNACSISVSGIRSEKKANLKNKNSESASVIQMKEFEKVFVIPQPVRKRGNDSRTGYKISKQMSRKLNNQEPEVYFTKDGFSDRPCKSPTKKIDWRDRLLRHDPYIVKKNNLHRQNRTSQILPTSNHFPVKKYSENRFGEKRDYMKGPKLESERYFRGVKDSRNSKLNKTGYSNRAQGKIVSLRHSVKSGNKNYQKTGAYAINGMTGIKLVGQKNHFMLKKGCKYNEEPVIGVKNKYVARSKYTGVLTKSGKKLQLKFSEKELKRKKGSLYLNNESKAKGIQRKIFKKNRKRNTNHETQIINIVNNITMDPIIRKPGRSKIESHDLRLNCEQPHMMKKRDLEMQWEGPMNNTFEGKPEGMNVQENHYYSCKSINKEGESKITNNPNREIVMMKKSRHTKKKLSLFDYKKVNIPKSKLQTELNIPCSETDLDYQHQTIYPDQIPKRQKRRRK